MRSYDLPSHELQPNTLQTVIIHVHVHVIIHVLLHNMEDKYFQIDSNLQYNRITSKTFIAFRCIMFYSLTEPLMLAQLLNKKSSCNSSLPLHLSPAPRLRFGKFRLSNCAHSGTCWYLGLEISPQKYKCILQNCYPTGACQQESAS